MPWLQSSTVSDSGHRVRARRSCRSSRTAAGTSMRYGLMSDITLLLSVELEIFTEPLHAVDLLRQRCVRPGVEHPRHGQDAADPRVFGPLVVGGGEGVGQRREDGEIIHPQTLFGAQLANPVGRGDR